TDNKRFPKIKHDIVSSPRRYTACPPVPYVACFPATMPHERPSPSAVSKYQERKPMHPDRQQIFPSGTFGTRSGNHSDVIDTRTYLARKSVPRHCEYAILSCVTTSRLLPRPHHAVRQCEWHNS